VDAHSTLISLLCNITTSNWTRGNWKNKTEYRAD